MQITGAPTKKVIMDSCFVAKILSGILLIVGLLNSGIAVSKDPRDAKNWMQGLAMFLLVAGASLMVLLSYDVLCKAGYERSILVAFAFIFVSMIISSLI